MRTPVIALVGQPNVGKSTLFNRLARRRLSIVEETPGVTRDRIYAQPTFEDVRFTLIDTGGLEPEGVPESAFADEIFEQSRLAIEEADAIIFLVDARAGATPTDHAIADILRKSNRPVVVAANKADSPKLDDTVGELYVFGFDVVQPISAEHGRGVYEMLEHAFELLPEELVEFGRELVRREEEGLDDDRIDDALDEAERWAERNEGEGNDDDDNGEPDAPAEPTVHMPDEICVAVIGKPNAGKSSFINKLIGDERHLVSPVAGTTMDAVDSVLDYGGHRFRLIDTAGIRRKRSIDKRLEKIAVVTALNALDRAHIALLLIDAVEGVTEQDLKIAAFAHEKGKALVLVVNKWDLSREAELTAKDVEEKLRDRMQFVSYAPMRFVSAKTGRRVFDVLDTAARIAVSYFTRLPTGRVNRALQDAVNAHNPPVRSGRRLRLFYGAQVKAGPPTFVFACNDDTLLHFSYRRYLTNRLRDQFGFEGAPLRLIFRARESNRPKMKRGRRASKRSGGRESRRKR